MLLDLLFPNRCLQCNVIISSHEIICDVCFSSVDFTHWSCLENNLLKQRCQLLFPTQTAWALMQFKKENLSQKIVHELKYGKRKYIGKILAEWAAPNLRFDNNKPDILITVPLHPKKLKIRGYNQLHLFGDTLSEYLKIPCNHELLRRNEHKKAQALQNKSKRNSHQSIFSLTQPIKNKHILIIDDVFTTGNTMSSIAWEILKEESNQISVIVMAID